MATNLIESVKSFFTPDVVDRASARLGETPDGIRKAVDGGVPMVFAGLVYRSEHGGAHGLLSDAHQAATHHLPGGDGPLFASDSTDLATTGNGWACGLFGDAYAGTTQTLASHAGIRNGSATTMLNLLTPLSLSVVGHYAIENDLNDWGLSTYLSEQKPAIMAAVPAGISMGRLFEEKHHGAVSTVSGHVPLTGERPLRVVPNTIWYILMVIAALGIIAYLIGR